MSWKRYKRWYLRSMIYFMYFKRDDIIYKIQLKQSRKRHLQHARHQALS